MPLTRPAPQFYHALSNAALRRVRTGFAAGPARTVFECALVVVLSYTTAFMESLTICGFPYYRFENRDQAYTLGSAFYGIYFLVSFPAFLRVDEDKKKPFTLAQSCTESLAASMAVLCLLDFVRLALGVELFTPH
jgi:cycloeucalenol cycloisomerase